MSHVVRSTVIDAPVEQVWALLRDFDGFDGWHPAIVASEIERGRPADQVGVVRRVTLGDGSDIREQLLGLSDADMVFSYCLRDTPVPLLNYVAHVTLAPVTDGDRTFWRWEARFDAPAGQVEAMESLVAEGIFRGGFDAVRARFAERAA